jgi:hypothetical protein
MCIAGGVDHWEPREVPQHRHKKEDNHTMAGLLEVPKEIKIRVARFLEGHDVVQLSCSCRALRKELVLRPLNPPIKFEDLPIDDQPDDPQPDGTWVRKFSFPLPILDLDTHSLVLSFTHFNFGRSHFAAKACVTAYPADASAKPPKELGVDEEGNQERMGRIVASYTSVPNIVEHRGFLQWTPREDEIYFFWYQTPIMVGQTILQTRIFDRVDNIITQQYQKLFDFDFIRWDTSKYLLKLHLEMICDMKAKLAPETAKFWQEHFGQEPQGQTSSLPPLDDRSLSAIENILKAFLKTKELQIRHSTNAE